MPIESLVFIDETGCNLSMSRTYGRSPQGERAIGDRPAGHRTHISTIGAMSVNGIEAFRTVEGSVNGKVFLDFVRETLVPHLLKGDIVVMDNLRVHHMKPVREAIEAAGAEVRFLPPYSCDLNPIEECWSKVKNLLKTCAARTKKSLLDALDLAIKAVTENDAWGWFCHGGYGIAQVK